jgi:hypothetical protein
MPAKVGGAARYDVNVGECSAAGVAKANDYMQSAMAGTEDRTPGALVRAIGIEAAQRIYGVGVQSSYTGPYAKVHTSYSDRMISDAYAAPKNSANFDLAPAEKEKVANYIRFLQTGNQDYKDPNLNKLHGQTVPKNIGMAYIKDPDKDPELNISHNTSDDVPSGAGRNYHPMPIPAVRDPESGLTDIQIKESQINTGRGRGRPDDPATLEHKETLDPTDITYGTSAAPYKVKTYPPKYGLQRSPPSAYNEQKNVRKSK